MADFSFLSDSDEDKAVEELLSQARDQVVLEQVAAINCCGFTDSVLPTHLETRFHKLKSFPNSSPKSSFSSNLPRSPKPNSNRKPFEVKNESKPRTGSNSPSDSDYNSAEENGFSPTKSFNDERFSPSKRNPDGRTEKNSKPQKKSSPFGDKSKPIPESESNSGSDSDKNSVGIKRSSRSKLFANDIFSPSTRNPDRKIAKESKSTSGSFSSRKTSTESTSPPSPTQKSGCFWFSPKKASSKSKEKKTLDMGIDWEMEDELLSDLNSFSAIKQKELLKKAMKLEQKIDKEAEKIAKLSKQVSAKHVFRK